MLDALIKHQAYVEELWKSCGRVGDVYDFMLFFKSFNLFPIKA
jgi:hypothetical protein